MKYIYRTDLEPAAAERPVEPPSYIILSPSIERRHNIR